MPAVLIVDDDPSVLDFVSHVLSARGYRVLVASDSTEAMQTAAKYKGPIALLLTDIAIPGLNGLELAMHVCAQRPDIKVVYISGYSEQFGFAVGRSPLIAKPFEADELLATVQEALSPSQQLASQPTDTAKPTVTQNS